MAEIASVFLYLLAQTRQYHWQTPVYIKHKAVGDFYDKMDDLVDTFIETYQGRYGRITYKPFFMTFDNLSDEQYVTQLMDFKKFLVSGTPTEIHGDTDLMNIRDEMLGATNHVMYLLNLR